MILCTCGNIMTHILNICNVNCKKMFLRTFDNLPHSMSSCLIVTFKDCGKI